MKNKILKKLSSLQLMINDISQIETAVIQNFIDETRRLLMTEVKNSKKFDVYTFSSNDKKSFPRYRVAAYINGYAYATDSTMLCKIPFHYSEEMEGKMFFKNGEELTDYNVLPYDKVIPNGDDYVEYEVDFDKMRSIFADFKIFAQRFKKKKDVRGYIKLESQNKYVWLALPKLEKMLRFMEAFGSQTIKIYNHNKPIVTQTKNGEVAILLPCYDPTVTADEATFIVHN